MKKRIPVACILFMLGCLCGLAGLASFADATSFFGGSGSGTPAPTASPTPTPAFVQAFHSTATQVVTLSSAQSGDCIVYAAYTNGANIAGLTPLGLGGFGGYAYSVAFGGGPPYIYINLHQVNAQDVATGVSGANTYEYLTALGSFGVVAAVDLRHTFCTPDGFGTPATSASTTSGTVGSFATTVANAVGIEIIGLQGTTNDLSACSTGYTLDPNAHSAASATAQGLAICVNPNVGAAGAHSPGNVASTLSTGTIATVAFGVQPYVNAY